MKEYSFEKPPIKIFGAPLIDRDGSRYRLTNELMEKLPNLRVLAKNLQGGRVCFRTNSRKFEIRYGFEKMTVDAGMSIFSCQSLHILAGNRENPRFLGVATPGSYEKIESSKLIDKKSDELEDIMIYLPRNESITHLEILIEDDAVIEAPTPYEGKPILYYGSSITEGGCACNPFNAYNAVISNHLNRDYFNFGFSGNAKGEICLAEYFATFDICLFVYDYDHNAPDAEHLRKTHEPFFKRFRELKPEVPVLFMTMPREIYDDWNKERREVIKQTYDNAIKSGDKNVYFIDGETFFGSEDRYRCTLDGVHPNDLGFDRMARVIEPVIKDILNIK